MHSTGLTPVYHARAFVSDKGVELILPGLPSPHCTEPHYLPRVRAQVKQSLIASTLEMLRAYRKQRLVGEWVDNISTATIREDDTIIDAYTITIYCLPPY